MCETCAETPSKCIKCAENRVNPPICGCPNGFSDDLVSS